MSFFNGLAEFFSDLNNWVFGVLIGVMGKISYELYMKRTITVIQWIAVVGLSIFSGYLTSVYCANNGLESEASWGFPFRRSWVKKSLFTSWLTTKEFSRVFFRFSCLRNERKEER